MGKIFNDILQAFGVICIIGGTICSLVLIVSMILQKYSVLKGLLLTLVSMLVIVLGFYTFRKGSYSSYIRTKITHR
mgnify:CR=1 FL=1